MSSEVTNRGITYTYQYFMIFIDDRENTHFSSPQQAYEYQHGQAILLFWFLHDRHENENKEDCHDTDQSEDGRAE